MPFASEHKKVGGRKAGTPNKLTGEAREVARRLLGDPEYQRSLQKRLNRGEAQRLELFLWQWAYGTPRVEPADTSKAAGTCAGLAQFLEKLDKSRTQNLVLTRETPTRVTRRRN